MRTIYPSDISRDQFSLIEGDLLAATKKTRPRVIDMYDIFCAVLYRMKEGCRWRALPPDFPKWQLCYYHYNLWRQAEKGKKSILDRVLRKLAQGGRLSKGC